MRRQNSGSAFSGSPVSSLPHRGVCLPCRCRYKTNPGQRGGGLVQFTISDHEASKSPPSSEVLNTMPVEISQSSTTCSKCGQFFIHVALVLTPGSLVEGEIHDREPLVFHPRPDRWTRRTNPSLVPQEIGRPGVCAGIRCSADELGEAGCHK